MKFVFNTWLLAIIIHAFAILAVNAYPGYKPDLWWLASLFTWMFFSTIISIPSLIIVYYLFVVVMKLKVGCPTKFYILVFIAPVVVLINIIIDSLIIQQNVFIFFEWPYFLASMFSATTAVVIQKKRFYRIDSDLNVSLELELVED